MGGYGVSSAMLKLSRTHTPEPTPDRAAGVAHPRQITQARERLSVAESEDGERNDRGGQTQRAPGAHQRRLHQDEQHAHQRAGEDHDPEGQHRPGHGTPLLAPADEAKDYLRTIGQGAESRIRDAEVLEHSLAAEKRVPHIRKYVNLKERQVHGEAESREGKGEDRDTPGPPRRVLVEARGPLFAHHLPPIRAAAASRPTPPASASNPRCSVAQSCGLFSWDCSSKMPCAPWSPG